MGDEWIRLIVSVLLGLAVTIPLIVWLVKYVYRAIEVGNQSQVMNRVIEYIGLAEEMFEKGTDRKEWVLAMARISADTFNCKVDIDRISVLIDSLCSMSKVVNNNAEVNTK